MDKCSSDAEFDSYWDYEAKNKNRNRIRVGRQYQATIPPLLKPGQKDGRKSEDLETLKWKPDQISDQAIEEYLSMAKGIGLFSKSLDSPKPSEKSENSLQSAIKGLSEFVTSHHPCHHDDGCKVASPSSSGESSKPTPSNDWSPSEAQLFAQALEACGKNFSAIKREYLPWKPIRSIIEYYYQGKSEKSETPSETQTSHELPVMKEETPSASCSNEEKACVKEEASPEDPQPQSSSNMEDTSKDTINFLENTRVTDPCRASPSESKMSVNNDLLAASSTVGSLNFFLGGRLVLKLNAQQDSGSGTKCQWVQSNDLPKQSNNVKKERHKKRCIQNGPFAIAPEPHKLKKRTDDSLQSKPSDCDPSAIKKPRMQSEYDFSESDRQGMLLCSTSWTPPVADGQEPLEVDDGSSKTSEGYVSPVLSYLRFSKADSKFDSVSNSNSVGELGEQRCDVDSCWAKGSSNSSENCTTNDSASKICILGGKNSPNQSSTISPYKQEVLNHKSALSHNKTCVKSLCYQPHSSSPLLKQWGKWPTLAYPLKTSPCSLSPINVVDIKSPLKENPLDLSSKPDHSSNDTDNHDPQNIHKSNVRAESIDKPMPSESESRPASNELSPQSSNHGSLVQSIESPCKENNSHKCPDDAANDNSQCEKCLLKENCDYSPGKDSENSSQLPYAYCNLQYHYALPKCTKDYSLEEVPLDLSSANENVKGRTIDPEPVSEDATAAGSENSEAVERGMLYQLLKNKTSK